MRDGMAEMVGRLRTYIGDPASETERFNDDELQAFLDGQARDVRGMPLPVPERRTAVSQGAPITTDYPAAYAPVGEWENVTLRDVYEVTLAPNASDLQRGIWTFSPALDDDRVYLDGTTYDLHGAAADALETWAATEASAAGGDITGTESMGLKITRSPAATRAAGLMEAAGLHRRRQRLVLGHLTRTDEC